MLDADWNAAINIAQRKHPISFTLPLDGRLNLIGRHRQQANGGSPSETCKPITRLGCGQLTQEWFDDLLAQADEQYYWVGERVPEVVERCIWELGFGDIDDEMGRVLGGATAPDHRLKSKINDKMLELTSVISDIRREVESKVADGSPEVSKFASVFLELMDGRESTLMDKINVQYIDAMGEMLNNPPAWSKYYKRH
jgi:hypothetical protein